MQIKVKEFAELLTGEGKASGEWQYAAAPMDSIPPGTSLKRIRKSVDRTLHYLDVIISSAANSTHNSRRYLGVIEGGLDLAERRRSAEETAKRPVAGFLIDGLLCGETDEQFKDILTVVSTALPRDKPRFLFGPVTELGTYLNVNSCISSI